MLGLLVAPLDSGDTSSEGEATAPRELNPVSVTAVWTVLALTGSA